MALEITCPVCGEEEDLAGIRRVDHIESTCGRCGQVWDRSLTPMCHRCGGSDLQDVPLAIIEKSRGTQLSVVGIRVVHLCSECDAEDLAHWQRNRPNPLFPRDLPTVDPEP